MALSRDQILSCKDIEKSIVEVDVPEWDGSVYVRVLSGIERAKFEIDQEHAPRELGNARCAAAAICDENGNLLFSDEDIEGLNKRSAIAMNRVIKAIVKLNGLNDAAIEAEAKNS